MANTAQLYLLADHIKLSLLERQRAISLNLDPNAQDGNISRSLESLREGIEGAERQAVRLEGADHATSHALSDQITRLRSQYDDLTSQFRGFPTTSPSAIATPNDPSLAGDFADAQATSPRHPSSSSSSFPAERSAAAAASSTPSKSVRFTDDDTRFDAEDDARRAALFPYRDDPAGPPDDHPRGLDNVQIHAYHQTVLREQDEQLDRLGDSIGRQRDLSIQIGDELDEHVQMLDEVEVHVDRHRDRLDGARKSLGQIARKANDNKQLTAIGILIVVLVLLIAILK